MAEVKRFDPTAAFPGGGWAPRQPCGERIKPQIRELSEPGNHIRKLSAVEFCEEWSLIYDNMLMFELAQNSPAWERRVVGLSCGERDQTQPACGHTRAQAVVTRIDGES